MKAHWVVFLMTESSIPRIVNALLNEGFSIKPGLNDNKFCLKDKTNGLVLVLEHSRFTDIVEFDKALIALLHKMEIPFYGAVANEPNTNTLVITAGRFPEIKRTLKPKSVEPGPYRKDNNVISFVPKDDGIIQDK